MTMNRLWVAAVVGAIALAGCVDDKPKETPSPSASASYTAPSPSSEPSPSQSQDHAPSPSPVESYPPPDLSESPEIAAIREGWQEYEDVIDRFSKDPSLMDFSDVSLVTTGQYTLEMFSDFTTDREKGIITEGDVIHRGVKITPPEKNADGVMSSTLTVCKDFTNHRVIDINTGEEAKPDEGREYVDTMFTTYTMQQLPNGKWVVASFQGEPKQC